MPHDLRLASSPHVAVFSPPPSFELSPRAPATLVPSPLGFSGFLCNSLVVLVNLRLSEEVQVWALGICPLELSGPKFPHP